MFERSNSFPICYIATQSKVYNCSHLVSFNLPQPSRSSLQLGILNDAIFNRGFSRDAGIVSLPKQRKRDHIGVPG